MKYRDDTLLQDGRDSDIINEIKDCGICGNIYLDFDNIELSNFDFDDEHINHVRKHSITREEAEQIILNAKFMVERWNGRFQNYYSPEGAVFVDVQNKKLRTAFRKEEFTNEVENAMEVLRRYER